MKLDTHMALLGLATRSHWRSIIADATIVPPYDRSLVRGFIMAVAPDSSELRLIPTRALLQWAAVDATKARAVLRSGTVTASLGGGEVHVALRGGGRARDDPQLGRSYGDTEHGSSASGYDCCRRETASGLCPCSTGAPARYRRPCRIAQGPIGGGRIRGKIVAATPQRRR